jgi:predicted esterase
MNPAVRTLVTVTAFLLVSASSIIAADVPADIADMKVEDLRAGGDAQKRYFVIQRPAQPPKDGWRTLFVLPGGPGNAEFQPFVTRMAKNAVPEGYLVVQLVAPVWTAQQAENIVWPNEKSGVREMKFSTFDFFFAVRAEVAKAHKLDPRYSFTLTWSSSGMSGYGLSLLPKAGVTGTFVAMSVFHPTTLPAAITRAKGHPYYIYHSPQDFIPIAQAEGARDALQKAGATVEFQTYEGGHGWHGDAFGNIRKGVEWMEEQATKAPRK